MSCNRERNDAAVLMVSSEPTNKRHHDYYDAFRHTHDINSPSRKMMGGYNGTPYYGQTIPFAIFEENNQKIHIFKTPGFHRGNTDVKQEWNNKDKELFINIVGRTWIGQVEHELNVHIFFDTTIYDKYEVNIADGLLHIIFTEIVNMPPEIKSIINGQESEDDK